MLEINKTAGLIALSVLFIFFISSILLNYQNISINTTNNTANNTNSLSNTTSNNIFNSSLKNTLSIINEVNNSAYIIFYPNLTSSYKYIKEAENISSKNLSLALSLLNKSKDNALIQEELLNKNKVFAFIITLIITIITIVILYFIIFKH